MPDDELFKLAEFGSLRKNRVARVHRVLRSEKSWSFAHDFSEQCLQTRTVRDVLTDLLVYGKFEDSMRGAMAEEVQHFFADILRRDSGIPRLIDADFTYLNETLARHYGIENVSGENFCRVCVDRRTTGRSFDFRGRVDGNLFPGLHLSRSARQVGAGDHAGRVSPTQCQRGSNSRE